MNTDIRRVRRRSPSGLLLQNIPRHLLPNRIERDRGLLLILPFCCIITTFIRRNHARDLLLELLQRADNDLYLVLVFGL